MYFRLRTDVADMSQYWERSNNVHVRLGRGRAVDVSEDAIDLPFRFTVTYSPGTDGAPKVQPLFDYVSNVKTMHGRLVTALQQAGVDNLQIFPAVVVDAVSGIEYQDYVVANVIGVVSCADLSRSSGEPIANAYYFNQLKIDPSRAHDLFLFRLKESLIEIVVHQKVAEAIERAGFRGIVLEPASGISSP